MASLTNEARGYKNPEEPWLKACGGDRQALMDAFLWKSTEEGQKFWEDEFNAEEPMSPELMERIKYLYVEWKILGDTDVRDKDG